MKAYLNRLPRFLHQQSFWSIMMAVLCVALTLVSVIHLLKPLYDNDFYWHLKTGCWIWDHKALPTSDPFSIPPQPLDPHRTQFMLTSYWLFQLILCAFYKIAGLSGIIIFRFILGSIFLALFYRFAVNKTIATTLVASIWITQILAEFFPERPQFISFVCCALLLTTVFTHLEEKKTALIPLLVPLCLIMLLWANTHGGFLLGVILLLVMLLAEGFKFIHPRLKPISRKEYINLTIAIIAAILTSIINPNHIFSFEMMRSYAEASSIIHTSTLENSHIFEYYQLMGGPQPALTMCTYLFTLFIFFKSRNRTNITWLGLLLLLGYMGLSHVRYYPFFFIVATLFAIRNFDITVTGTVARSVIMAFFITVLTLSLAKTPQNIRSVAQYGWVPAGYFPVKVCDYLVDHHIEGNVFTLLDWGGYLLWRLPPQQKLFIDGRHLDPARSWEYFFYVGNWKILYDKYNIRAVIIPTYDAPRIKSEVFNKLALDPEWQLVNSNNNGSLFVRK